MRSDFAVSAELRGDEFVLRVTGELDVETCPRVEAALRVPDGCARVRVDLSELAFMDSCGLNLLLRLRLRLMRRHTALTLPGLHGQPRLLFDAVGAHEVFGTAGLGPA